MENIETIQIRRKAIWEQYHRKLKELETRGLVKVPEIPAFATNNAHMFYLVCRSLEERTALIKYLKNNGILSVFHYLSLHLSEYYVQNNKNIPFLPKCDRYADCLVRLPLFYELSDNEINIITDKIIQFYNN